MMGGLDYDDQATAHEVWEHFGLDVSRPRSEDVVVLKSENANLALAAEHFSTFFLNAFWAGAPWPNWQSAITAAGVGFLAKAARCDGHHDEARQLERFQSDMDGPALVEDGKGQPWKPYVPPAHVDAEATKAAERKQTAQEVLEFFSGDTRIRGWRLYFSRHGMMKRAGLSMWTPNSGHDS
jgi:hypothetical protein